MSQLAVEDEPWKTMASPELRDVFLRTYEEWEGYHACDGFCGGWKDPNDPTDPGQCFCDLEAQRTANLLCYLDRLLKERLPDAVVLARCLTAAGYVEDKDGNWEKPTIEEEAHD
jgi:hypothetical protein